MTVVVWMKTRDSAARRAKLLEAARDVIRAKGYAATTVDDICAAAGVTKGAFFHHFASKEAMGIAAVEAFDAMAEGLFTTAPYTRLEDPRDRVFGYVEFRAAMLDGEISQFTCLLGTTVQEVHASHPLLRNACDKAMTSHVVMLAKDIEAAKRKYAPKAKWSAESVGYFMQSVLQGAFIYAKAKQGNAVALETLAHLRAYLESLLGSPMARKPREKKK